MIGFHLAIVVLFSSLANALVSTSTTRTKTIHCGPSLQATQSDIIYASSKFLSLDGYYIHRTRQAATSSIVSRIKPVLFSSFYGDFEKFDDEDDDDEDDDEDDDDDSAYEVRLDQDAVADFRSRMGSLFGDDDDDETATSSSSRAETDNEDDATTTTTTTTSISSIDELISFATKSSSSSSAAAVADWAFSTESLQPGVILLANPAKFCPDLGSPPSTPSPRLLNKFGLTLPPPADLGPDRRADLLPVLMLLDRHPLRGSQAVLLNRRTGYLLGDLEPQPNLDDDDDNSQSQQQSSLPPRLGAFMIQPLWFGGTSAGGADDGMSSSSGLDMLHLCPTVLGAKRLTDDGMYWGGDPVQAQDAMTDPSLERIMTGFDFKFFVQSTRWLPLQLESELRDGTWFVAQVSKEVIFKSRDRMGTRRAKPLWTEIMELMGGEYKTIRDQLYGDQL